MSEPRIRNAFTLVELLSENISSVGGESGFGVWGALGTRDGGESATGF